MRLVSIAVRNSPPITRFEVGDLSDVVVIAGPNGVGKTRLTQRIIEHLRSTQPHPDIQAVIAATSPEERTAWAKDQLDLSTQPDAALFRQTIQAARSRKRWRSSLVNFESDRTIQNLQPYAFSWDVIDPYEEGVSWDQTFQFLRQRFQDTLNSMFRLIESQKRGISSRAITLRREGRTSMQLEFDDPMEPFKNVFRQLVGPKELVDPSPQLQRLEFSLGGQTFGFDALSSGEREVVNVAFDFLLRAPEDCIVFFDEPELHLHPELSYRLIRTLRQIGVRNQFIFTTHSPDIITSSLDQSVVFIGPPSGEAGEPANQALPVVESDKTNQALRLLGQSIGVIALGKKIVLIEGSEASVDKQAYGSIIGTRWPGLVLVPSGGRHVIENFDEIDRNVLSQTVWGVDFFMLCDGDTTPAGAVARSAEKTGRLRVLRRYHLENYFLDEHVLAAALGPMERDGSWLRDPAAIRRVLREIAQQFVSYATALSVSLELRRTFGNVDVMPSDSHAKAPRELGDLFSEAIDSERHRLDTLLSPAVARSLIDEKYEALKGSIDRDTDDWKRLIPGKPILGVFSGKAQLSPARLKTLYISAAEAVSPSPFEEVFSLFADFSA